MAGRSKISQHPKRDAIVNDISSGLSNVTIARKYSLSESSVSRQRSMQLAELEEEATDSLEPKDLIQRLVDLANSTRKARILADRGLSPAAKAKAQSNELAALEKLLTRTGVTDITVLEILGEANSLVVAIRTLVDSRPDIVPDLLQALSSQKDLAHLIEPIRGYAKREK